MDQHLDGIARREFLRRGAVLGISGTALSGLLAACGGDSGGGGGTGTDGKPGGALTAWAWQPRDTGYPAVWDGAGKQWTSGGSGRSYEYTYVEFANYFTKFKTANAGGQPPDALEMSWTGDYHDLVRANALEPLDDLLPSLPRFFPAVMESLLVDGRTYAIPQDVNTLSIAFNVELFRRLGLALPRTLDELLALAKPIRDAGLQPLSLAVKDQWPSGDVWFAQLAYTDATNRALADANAGEMSWDAPPFQQANDMVEKIGKSGLVADGASSLDTNGSIALFGQQKALMLYPAGNFLTGLIDSASKGRFTYDLFPFPPLTSGAEQRATGGPAVLWSIASNAKNVAAARDYLRFLTDVRSNELLVRAGFYPASPFDLRANSNAIYQKMASFQDAAASRAIFEPEVYAALLNASSAVLAGDGSASSIAEAMTKAV